MKKRSALAFRPELHTPDQIIEYCRTLDNIESLSHVFIPDIPGGLESIEICAAALANTMHLKIGSGVIRILEHNNAMLRRRLETLQSISEGRFFLGVGTGSVGPNPGEIIRRMLSQLDDLRSGFSNERPQIFIATLKNRIASKAVGHCDGLLLNFCSPEFAKRMVEKVSKSSFIPIFACYLKLFYCKDKTAADRLLIEEFAKYDSLRQYHEMFEQDGISSSISDARKTLSSGTPIVPQELMSISLSNPDPSKLKEYADRFREAGIDLPCAYPYFVKGEEFKYKKSIIEQIADSI